MMVTNDAFGKWINGSMGTIKDLGEDYIDVQIGTETIMV